MIKIRFIFLMLFISSLGFSQGMLFDEAKSLKEELNIIEVLIHQKIDSLRARKKLKGLNNNDYLFKAASFHAKWMNEKRKFSHVQNKSKTKTPQKRVDFVGGNSSFVGENIAYTLFGLELTNKKGKRYINESYEALANDLVQMWRHSKGHYKNILTKDFKTTGIALSVDFESKKYMPFRYLEESNIMSEKVIDLLIVGGGAAGFFTAINYAGKNPIKNVVILEKGKQVLGKVKVSGGGRCNVTHACFEPRELVKFYPRGNRELMGPFSQFMTGDTMEWFENRGVSLKIENDNRVFPVTDDSQTIIDCFMDEVNRLGIKVIKQEAVSNIQFENELWKVETLSNDYLAKRIVLASGGNSKSILESIENLGLKTIENIPSLFTFNTKDTRFRGLAGVVSPMAGVKIAKTKFKESGPLLITHWGVSGPSILKLSSVSARELHEMDYKFTIQIDWCLNYDAEEVKETFAEMRENHPKKAIINTNLFDLPKRMWISLVEYAKIPSDKIWAEVGKKELNRLQEVIKNSQVQINGKSTNKEEFVSCGGVDLKEINFSDFSSKKHPTMHVVGELLNIDALTGGFNFQAAWTGGFVVGNALG